MKKEMNNKGFSLVELIIVIAIMAVLVGVMAPQYLKYVKNSKVSTDITNASNVLTVVNTAIADGNINLPANGTTDSSITGAAGTGNISDGSLAMSKFPESKVSAGATWVVGLDPKGVSLITLGGQEIWPDAENHYKSAHWTK